MKNPLTMAGGGEIENFIKVWTLVIISLIYCYAISNSIPKGSKRLISVLPVVALFLYLPLHLTSIHLGGTTAFFLAWLANFKLLLFSFGKGPLIPNSDNPRRLSLPLFVAASSLPIKIQQNRPTISSGRESAPLIYTLKTLTLAVLVRVYADYGDRIHPKILLTVGGFLIYFVLDPILAVTAATARNVLGLDLEPMFDEPYLATSLQDFWGRRWNLSVTRILRPAVYDPIRELCSPAWWAPVPAVLAAFLVSGLMHEVMFYYMGRGRPIWGCTWFFLLQGACVTVEVVVKKAAAERRWLRLPEAVSGALTIGFVMGTGCWLFFPRFVQCKVDVRALEEYAAVGKLARSVGRRIFYYAGGFVPAVN